MFLVGPPYVRPPRISGAHGAYDVRRRVPILQASATRGTTGRSLRASSFVGRRQEVAEVKRLLAAHRLVSLTGPGGVGKTRLALHVLPALAKRFADGLHLVQLAGVRDASLVPLALVEALNIRDVSGRSPVEVLVEHLGERDLLLVLDNCEHLADACAELVGMLLARTARVRVLATSRHPLGVAGQHVLEVQPLPTPAPGEPLPPKPALEYPALALFADRAADVLPGFALTADNQEAVAALCHRLDGLPLAIELAAVRMRALGVRQVLDRLDRRYRLLTDAEDAPARHRTLRATVDWSHDLCTPQERAVWAHASVFAGSFDLDAVEEVCAGAGLDRDATVDAVAGLVDKSLLVRDGDTVHARYRMLESIRHYGLDRLRESGAGAQETARARARALWSLALMLLSQGDAVRGGPLAEESHELALRLGDGTEAAHTFFGRGGALLISGAYERAREVYEEALAEPPREGESMSLVGFKYVELAHVLSLQGEHGRAMALCAEFRRICLVHGEQWIHSYLLRILAFAEWSQGDQVSARTHARECLRLKRAVGDVFGIGITLELLAAVHARAGEGRSAAVLLGAARRIWREAHVALDRTPSHGPVRDEAEEDARALLGEAFGHAHREGLELALDDAVGYALGERRSPVRPVPVSPLTRREAEVAELLGQGLTNQQIADRLVVAVRTAEGHVERILGKLGFTSRSQVAVWTASRSTTRP
ncbi:ATP-binding protein [Streptomyces sp. NBC_00019]|uniref:ATP-binding protein n=1 Tax=Streptomyces sp. NBC_00019 TaxID=2975623 RepID=UPI0032457371